MEECCSISEICAVCLVADFPDAIFAKGLLFSQILPGGKSAARGKLQLVHQLEYAFHTKDGEEVGDELIISSTVMSTGLLRVGGVAP